MSEEAAAIREAPPPSVSLPAALAHSHGWRWGSRALAKLRPAPHEPLPSIAVVTPSFNQASFLEQTICSVLLQRYPRLEYLVMDGGSADGSVSTIRRYENRLAHWQSGPDGGQAAAIADGFWRSSAEVLGWVNSDDYLLPGALLRVGRFFARNPEAEFVVCGGIAVDAGGALIRKYYSFPQPFDSLLAGGQFFMQMSSFWRRSAYERAGGLDTTLRFCFDYDLFLRLARQRPPRGLDIMAAAFRIHDRSKTATIWKSVALPEFEQVRSRYGFDQASEAARARSSKAVIASYYSATWSGIVRDLYRDPRYFGRCLLNKLRGRPASSPVGPS